MMSAMEQPAKPCWLKSGADFSMMACRVCSPLLMGTLRRAAYLLMKKFVHLSAACMNLMQDETDWSLFLGLAEGQDGNGCSTERSASEDRESKACAAGKARGNQSVGDRADGDDCDVHGAAGYIDR